MPLTMALIPDADWTWSHTAIFVIVALFCGWIPAVLVFRTRRENGYATVWDLISGTRVVVKPKGIVRPSIEPVIQPEIAAEEADSLSPYKIIKELVLEKWIVVTDFVLRRKVWLLKRDSLELPLTRRHLSRPGRLRWLQKVETTDVTWDAFEGPEGVPFSNLIEGDKQVPWSSLRHWLHDLASELWDATGDQTLPAKLSLDHIWITTSGRAILLDVP